ncbi:unnamed protein product [Closterium sp. NIES-54]
MDRKDSPLSPLSSPASSYKSSSSHTVSAGIWAMNILGAVGIIMVNKQLMSVYGFTFAIVGLLVSALAGSSSRISSRSCCSSSSSSSNVTGSGDGGGGGGGRGGGREEGKAAAAVLPLWVLLGFALLGNASLVATNFSLLLNSVGFYQISKVAVIPLVCLFESLAWHREIARGVWASMAVVMVGVGLCTNADISLNVVGFCVASLAVVCSALHMMVRATPCDTCRAACDVRHATCPVRRGMCAVRHVLYSVRRGYRCHRRQRIFLYLPSASTARSCIPLNVSSPVRHPHPLSLSPFSPHTPSPAPLGPPPPTIHCLQLIGWLQDHYATSSFDLLSQTAPLQALLLLLIGPPLDFYLTSRSLLAFHFSPGALLFLLLSGLLAVACNLSVYLCIGRFSATTYQVLGHVKTVLVIGIGVVFFHSPLSLHSMLGMSLAVLGMAMYGRATQCTRISTSSGKTGDSCTGNSSGGGGGGGWKVGSGSSFVSSSSRDSMSSSGSMETGTGRAGCIPGGVACCDDGITVVKHAWGRVMHAWAWDEAERSFVPVAGRTVARGIGLAAGVGGGGGGLMVRATAAAPQLRVPLLAARDVEAGRG